MIDWFDPLIHPLDRSIQHTQAAREAPHQQRSSKTLRAMARGPEDGSKGEERRHHKKSHKKDKKRKVCGRACGVLFGG